MCLHVRSEAHADCHAHLFSCPFFAPKVWAHLSPELATALLDVGPAGHETTENSRVQVRAGSSLTCGGGILAGDRLRSGPQCAMVDVEVLTRKEI